MIRLILITGLLLLPVNTHEDSDLLPRSSEEFRQNKNHKDKWNQHTESLGAVKQVLSERRTTTAFNSGTVTSTDWTDVVGDQTLQHSGRKGNKRVNLQSSSARSRSLRLKIKRHLNTDQRMELRTNKLRTLWSSKMNKMRAEEERGRFRLKNNGSAKFLPLFQAKLWRNWKKGRKQLKANDIPKPIPNGAFNYSAEENRPSVVLQPTQNALINAMMLIPNTRGEYQRHHHSISINNKSLNTGASSERMDLARHRRHEKLLGGLLGQFIQQESESVKPASLVLGSVSEIAKKAETQKLMDVIEKVVNGSARSAELPNKAPVSLNAFVSSLGGAKVTTGTAAPSASKKLLNSGQIKKDASTSRGVRTRALQKFPGISTRFQVSKKKVKLIAKPISTVSAQLNVVEKSDITSEETLAKDRNQLSQVALPRIPFLNQPEITRANADILKNMNTHDQLAANKNLTILEEADIRHLNQKNNDRPLNVDRNLSRISKLANKVGATTMSRSTFNVSDFDFLRSLESFNVLSKVSGPIKSVVDQEQSRSLSRWGPDISHLKKIGSSSDADISGSRLAMALIKKLMINGGSLKSGLKRSPIKLNSLKPTEFQGTSKNDRSKKSNIKQHMEITASKTLNQMKPSRAVLNFLQQTSTQRLSHIPTHTIKSDIKSSLHEMRPAQVDTKPLDQLGLPDIVKNVSLLKVGHSTTGKLFHLPERKIDSVESSLFGLRDVSKNRPQLSNIPTSILAKLSTFLQLRGSTDGQPSETPRTKPSSVDSELLALLGLPDIKTDLSALFLLDGSTEDEFPVQDVEPVDSGNRHGSLRLQDVSKNIVASPEIKRLELSPVDTRRPGQPDFVKDFRDNVSTHAQIHNQTSSKTFELSNARSTQVDSGLLDLLRPSGVVANVSTLLKLVVPDVDKAPKLPKQREGFVNLEQITAWDSGTFKDIGSPNIRMAIKKIKALPVNSTYVALGLLKAPDSARDVRANISALLQFGHLTAEKASAMKKIVPLKVDPGLLDPFGFHEVKADVSALLGLDDLATGKPFGLSGRKTNLVDSGPLNVTESYDISNTVIAYIATLLQLNDLLSRKISRLSEEKSDYKHSELLSQLGSADLLKNILKDFSTLKSHEGLQTSRILLAEPNESKEGSPKMSQNIQHLLANVSRIFGLGSMHFDKAFRVAGVKSDLIKPRILDALVNVSAILELDRMDTGKSSALKGITQKLLGSIYPVVRGSPDVLKPVLENTPAVAKHGSLETDKLHKVNLDFVKPGQVQSGRFSQLASSESPKHILANISGTLQIRGSILDPSTNLVEIVSGLVESAPRGNVKGPYDIPKKILDKNFQALPVGNLTTGKILEKQKSGTRLDDLKNIVTNISALLEIRNLDSNKIPILPAMKPGLVDSGLSGVLKLPDIPKTAFVNISALLQHGRPFLSKPSLSKIPVGIVDSSFEGSPDIVKQVLPNASVFQQRGKNVTDKTPVLPVQKPGLFVSGILGTLRSSNKSKDIVVNASAILGTLLSKPPGLPSHTDSEVLGLVRPATFLGKNPVLGRLVSDKISGLLGMNTSLIDSGLLSVLISPDMAKKHIANISSLVGLGSLPTSKSSGFLSLVDSRRVDVLGFPDIDQAVLDNVSLGSLISENILNLTELKSNLVDLGLLGLPGSPDISNIFANLSATFALGNLVQGETLTKMKSDLVASSILGRPKSPGTAKEPFAKVRLLLKAAKSAMGERIPLTKLKPDLVDMLCVGTLRAAGVPLDIIVNASTFLELGILDKVKLSKLLKAQPDLTGVNLLDLLKPSAVSPGIFANVSKLKELSALDAGKPTNLFEVRSGLLGVDINLLSLLTALGISPSILANVSAQLGISSIEKLAKEALHSFLDTCSILKQFNISDNILKILPKTPASDLDKQLMRSKVLPELLKFDLRNFPSNISSSASGKALTTLITIAKHTSKATGLVDVLKLANREDAFRQVYPGKQRTVDSKVTPSRIAHVDRVDSRISQPPLTEQRVEKLSLIKTMFVLEIISKLCIAQSSKSAICDTIRDNEMTPLVTGVMGLGFKEKQTSPFSLFFPSTDAFLKLCLSATVSSSLLPLCQRVVTTRPRSTKPSVTSTLSVVQPKITKRPNSLEILRKPFKENQTDITLPIPTISLPNLFRETIASVPRITTPRPSFPHILTSSFKISKIAETGTRVESTPLLSGSGFVRLCQAFPVLLSPCRKIQRISISKPPTTSPNIAELLKKISAKRQPSELRTVLSPKVTPKPMSLNTVQTPQPSKVQIHPTLLSSLLRPALPEVDTFSHICLTTHLLNLQSILCQKSANIVPTAASTTTTSAPQLSLSLLLQLFASKVPPVSDLQARPIPTPSQASVTQMLSSGVNLFKHHVVTDEVRKFPYPHAISGQGPATQTTTTIRPSLHRFGQESPMDKFINLCISVSIHSPLFALCQQVRRITMNTSHSITTIPPATQPSMIDLFRRLIKLKNETMIMGRKAKDRTAKHFIIRPTTTAKSNTLKTILKSSVLPYLPQAEQTTFSEDFAKFLKRFMKRFHVSTLTDKTDTQSTPSIISMPSKTITKAIPTTTITKNILTTTPKPAPLTFNSKTIPSTASKMLSATIKTVNKTTIRKIIPLRAPIISKEILPTSVEDQVKINVLTTSRSNISHPMMPVPSRSPLIDLLRKLLSVLERHLVKISPPVKSALQEIRKTSEAITTIGTPPETTFSTTATTALLTPRVQTTSDNNVLGKPEPENEDSESLSRVHNPEEKLSSFLKSRLSGSGRRTEAIFSHKETADRRFVSRILRLLPRQRTIATILRRMGYLQRNERRFPLTSDRYRTAVNGVVPLSVLRAKAAASQRYQRRYHPILLGPLNAFNLTSNLTRLHEQIYPRIGQSNEPRNHLSGINASNIRALLRIRDSLRQSDFKGSGTITPQSALKALTIQRYLKILDEERMPQTPLLRANSRGAFGSAISRGIPVSLVRGPPDGKTVDNSLTKRRFLHTIVAPNTLNLNIHSIQVPIGNKGNISHYFDQTVPLFNAGRNV